MSDPIAQLNKALEGRYAVESELGQGGMATVYLAEDLRHERKVALKVLKPELAAVVGAERFLAEIKTTANLQHPHVLPLFDSGEADSFLFYVMPYVEGETLRDRIERDKQLPVDEGVRIATAVANALQHAHDRGVIHRDIKPANILMQDGQPVVADFGIALAVGAAGGSRLTETGLSVGTPYYMSPEQATGDQSLGPSSDTYALGAVLYEMLVGDPPYMGSTAQAVLGQIISGVPVSATTKRRSIPANVDAAIRKSLEKLPADRFKTAADFAAALADPSFRLAGAAAGSAAGAGPWKLVAAAMALVAVASLGGLGLALSTPEPPKRVDRLSLVMPDEPLATGQIQLLPDGSGLVYRASNASGQSMLWHRPFADLTATPIRGTENAGSFFSVQGDPLEVTFTLSSTIRAVPVMGGPSRLLAEDANCCTALGDDGFFYFLALDGSAKRVPRAGGPEEVVAALETGEAFRWISHVLPGAGHGFLNVFRSGTDTDIRVIDLETFEVGEPILVGHQARYVDPGIVIYVTGEGTVMAATFDLSELTVRGFPVPLIEDVAHVNTYALALSVSETGDLLYRTSASGTELSVTPMWVDRDGSARSVDPDWSFTGDPTTTSLNLSPDGSRLAVSYPRDGTSDIWIKTLDTGPEQRLTFEGSVNRRPMWSPDGSMITFVSARTTPSSVWERRADGSAPARQVFAFEQTIQEALHSPDGQHMVIKVGAAPTDLLAVPTAGGDETIPLLTTEFNEYSSTISPDGRWLAYVSNESGRSEIYVRPFPDVGSGLWQVSSDGGREPLWAHNGEELFYRSFANELVSVRYSAEPTFAMLGEEVLFSMAPFLVSNGRPQYTISPDDQRFIMLRLEAANDEGVVPAEVIYVRNWIEEVKARLEIGN